MSQTERLKKLVFTFSLLDIHIKGIVWNQPASLIVGSLGKARNETASERLDR